MKKFQQSESRRLGLSDWQSCILLFSIIIYYYCGSKTTWFLNDTIILYVIEELIFEFFGTKEVRTELKRIITSYKSNFF